MPDVALRVFPCAEGGALLKGPVFWLLYVAVMGSAVSLVASVVGARWAPAYRPATIAVLLSSLALILFVAYRSRRQR